jgi:hypothetical protein
MVTTLMILTALTPTGDTDDPEPMPRFETKFLKNDDAFEAGLEKGTLVWKITSQSGIGDVVVSLKAGSAPKKITIRFPGLRSMEHLRLETGNLNLSTQLERNTKRVVYFDDKGAMAPDAKTSTGSLSIEQTKDAIEVVLVNPRPGKQWLLWWVDAYR